MATIYREIAIESAPDKVWAALRDFGAVHTRVAPGFVTDCHLEPDAKGEIRVVTFFNGNVARERLVGVDERERRLAYTVLGGRATHHNASAQVFAAGANGSRFVWITDILPHELAAPIGAMMEQGAVVIKSTLER